MYTLVIGRAYPEESTGMMGIFEFEQAKALSRNETDTVYAFCDTRSIKRLRKIGDVQKKDEIPVSGRHLPIGGIPTYCFNKVKSIYFLRKIKEIINKHGMPEIIHVHFPLLTMTDEIWGVLKKSNVPIVVTEHWSKVQTKDLEDYRLKLLKRVVKESSAFICVGELLRKSVIDLTGADKDIYVIPNMVSAEFNNTYQRKKRGFNFISIGRLIKSKGFDILINSFAQSFKDVPSATLTIVGGGPLELDLKKQVDKLGIRDKVNFTGLINRDEIAKHIQKSDVLVSASSLETFGVPFIEAMTCGKPVIGFKGGPMDKYIIDSVGLLVRRNTNDLKLALLDLYHNIDDFNNDFISKYAYEHFSASSVTNKLKNIYQDILNRERDL